MKPPQFFITLILSAICVLLSLLTIWQGQSLSKSSLEFDAHKNDVSREVQEKQVKINQGNQLQQVLFRMVQEIMAASSDSKGVTKDEKLKALVADAGIKINLPQASPSPSPTSTNP